MQAAAYERAIKEFGITVTPAEVAAWTAQLSAQTTPEKLQRAKDMRDLIPPALAEVYDQHADPQKTYAERLQGHGITLEEWQAFLSMPNAKTAEGRSRIAQQYQTTVDNYQNPGANASNRQLEVEGQKLNAAIDQKLAQQDAQFAAHLSEYRAALAAAPIEKGGGQLYRLSPGAYEYMTAKRDEFWRNETAKLNVRLSDPMLKAKCNLGVQ